MKTEKLIVAGVEEKPDTHQKTSQIYGDSEKESKPASRFDVRPQKPCLSLRSA